MDDSPERRHPGSGADFESPAENGGDAAEATAAEEVGEMRHLDGVRPGPARDRSNREGGRQSPRGAHAESLPDGKFVREPDRELAGRRGASRRATSSEIGHGPG